MKQEQNNIFQKINRRESIEIKYNSKKKKKREKLKKSQKIKLKKDPPKKQGKRLKEEKQKFFSIVKVGHQYRLFYIQIIDIQERQKKKQKKKKSNSNSIKFPKK